MRVAELFELAGPIEADPDLTVVVFDSANPDFYLAYYDTEGDPAKTLSMAPGPTGMHPWLDLTARLRRAPAVSIASILGHERGAWRPLVGRRTSKKLQSPDLEDAAQHGATDHQDMDGAPITAGRPGAPLVSAQRALLSDARLAAVVLNQARYPVLTRMFGVPREQANLLTFVLALSAASATYDALRRIIRHPWPLSGTDTGIAGFLVREVGFDIAGPKAREVQLGGALIALAAVGRLTLPGMRRGLHDVHVAEQRVMQQRRMIYGAAQPARDQAPHGSVRPRRHLGEQIARLSDVPARSLTRLRSARQVVTPELLRHTPRRLRRAFRPTQSRGSRTPT